MLHIPIFTQTAFPQNSSAPMSEKGKGLNLVWYLLILLTVFLWGMSFLWSDRVLDRQVPVFTFIFTRMIIAAAALSLFSLLTGRFQRIRKGDFKWFAAMTAFASAYPSTK